MSARSDAIVIGGGAGGLIAASYLRIAGLKTLLLEAGETLGGRKAPILHALDPRATKELALTRRGLKFAARDLPLAVLRRDGRHLVLPRDPNAAARAIAAHSPADAAAYRRYHAELFALARTLRAFWWEADAVPHGLPARLEAMSASAWLGSWFESEVLKVALCFDVPEPLVPGSALALVWRAAQEMCGLQGAVAAAEGLSGALIAAAKEEGVEFRTKARVAKLILDGNAAAGVELDGGETIYARKVVSSLSRRDTLLALAPTASAGFDETARLAHAANPVETEIVFTLNAAPEFPFPSPARFAIAEGEPALEAVVFASAQPGQYGLFVRAKGAVTADQAIAQLERHTPHLRARIVDRDVRSRHPGPPQLLTSARQRIATPVEGLFLCGGAAEPLDAVSGRAARLAAAMAVREKTS